MQAAVTQSVAATCSGIKVSSTKYTFAEQSSSHNVQSLVAGGKYVITKTELYVRPLAFDLIGCSTSCFVLLVMVDIECIGGHSHHGGDDLAGAASY